MVELLVHGRLINRHFDRTFGRNFVRRPACGWGMWGDTRFLGRALRVGASESQIRERRLDCLQRFPLFRGLQLDRLQRLPFFPGLQKLTGYCQS